jgi:metallo-beta-lactamase class B
MDADVPVVESGGKADFLYGENHALYFEPGLADRILHDKDTVELGGMTLTAQLTAGHTRGKTTWTFDEPGLLTRGMASDAACGDRGRTECE